MKTLLIISLSFSLVLLSLSGFSQKRTSTVNSIDGSQTIKYSYGMGSYMNLPITFITLNEKSDTTHYCKYRLN